MNFLTYFKNLDENQQAINGNYKFNIINPKSRK